MRAGAKILSKAAAWRWESDPLWDAQFLLIFWWMLFSGMLHPWESWAWQAPPGSNPGCSPTLVSSIIYFSFTHSLLSALMFPCEVQPVLGQKRCWRGAGREKMWELGQPRASLPQKRALALAGAEPALQRRFWTWICCRKSQQKEFCPRSNSEPIPVLALPTPSRRKSGIPEFSVSNRNCLSLGFNRQKGCWNQTFFGICWHY